MWLSWSISVQRWVIFDSVSGIPVRKEFGVQWSPSNKDVWRRWGLVASNAAERCFRSQRLRCVRVGSEPARLAEGELRLLGCLYTLEDASICLFQVFERCVTVSAVV